MANLLATVAALRSFRIDRRDAVGSDTVELKERLTNYLASVATPADMQAKSAEIARLMTSAAFLSEGWRAHTYRALWYPLLLGGFNVVAIGIGLWMGKVRAATVSAVIP